jgi:hypothetical protein
MDLPHIIACRNYVHIGQAHFAWSMSFYLQLILSRVLAYGFLHKNQQLVKEELKEFLKFKKEFFNIH